MRALNNKCNYGFTFVGLDIKYSRGPKRLRLFALLPDGFEVVPPRFAIDHRNRWMINQSDFVVTYVRSPIGGAEKFKALAERKGKPMVEVANSSSSIYRQIQNWIPDLS